MNKIEKKICIVGAGGFGRESLLCVIDSIAETDLKIEEVACFMVDDQYLTDRTLLGVEVIPRSSFDPKHYHVVVAIGDPVKRQKMVESLPSETIFTSIIHPTAVISKWVQIGNGAIITANVVITCDIKIGKHAQLNLHTTIGHDCEFGDYFTTAPGANISGNCKFGDGVYFGTNSAVREGVSICNNVTIGMGGVVVKDIHESGVYIGNPLRKLEKK